MQYKRRVAACLARQAFLFSVWISWMHLSSTITPYNRYEDEFTPFRMMAMNKAYEDNLLVKNGIGFHFAYSFQPVKDELYLFRRIDMSYLFKGISVLHGVAQVMDKHCKDMRTPPGPRSKRSMYDNTNFFVAHRYNTTKQHAQAVCRQQGAFLPEIYDTNTMAEMLNIMNIEGLKTIHSGTKHELREGTKIFITTGLPVTQGYASQVYRHSDDGSSYVKGDFSKRSQDFREEWLYHSHGDFYMDANSDMDYYIQATSGGDPKYKGAPVICQRVIQPPSGYSLTQFTKEKETDEAVVQEVARHAKELEVLAVEYKRFCTAAANATRQAALELETRLANAMQYLNIEISSIQPRVTEAWEISKAWEAFLDSKQYPGKTEKEIAIIKAENQARRSRVKRGLPGLMMTGLASLTTSAIAQLIRYHYHREKVKKEEEISEIVKEHSMKLDDLSIQDSIFKETLTDVVDKLDNLESTTGSFMAYSTKNTELETLKVSVDQAVDRTGHALSRLEAISHSSSSGETHMFAIDDKQFEKAKSLVALQSEGLLKDNLANMKSGFMVDPEDSQFLVLVISVPTVTREAYIATEMVPLRFYSDDYSYQQKLKAKYVAMDQHAKKFYEMEEKEFIKCRFHRCSQKNLIKRIADHPCELPIKSSAKDMEKCQVEYSTNMEPFFKLQHPDGVLYSVPYEMDVSLTCADKPSNNRFLFHELYNNRLTNHGIINIPQGCQLDVVKKGTVEITIPGPPEFRMIDLGAMDFTVKAETNNRPGLLFGAGPEIIGNELRTITVGVLNSLKIRVAEVESFKEKAASTMEIIVGVISGLAIMVLCAIGVVIWLFKSYRDAKVIMARLIAVVPARRSVTFRRFSDLPPPPPEDQDEVEDNEDELPPLLHPADMRAEQSSKVKNYDLLDAKLTEKGWSKATVSTSKQELSEPIYSSVSGQKSKQPPVPPKRSVLSNIQQQRKTDQTKSQSGDVSISSIDQRDQTTSSQLVELKESKGNVSTTDTGKATVFLDALSPKCKETVLRLASISEAAYTQTLGSSKD